MFVKLVVKRCNMAFAEGTKPVNIVGGAITFYEEYTTTNLYVERVA